MFYQGFIGPMWVLGFVPFRWVLSIGFLPILELVSDWADISFVLVCCFLVLLVL